MSAGWGGLAGSSAPAPHLTTVIQDYPHRIRINIEEKAKVLYCIVAAVWGTELIPFLAALAVLY